MNSYHNTNGLCGKALIQSEQKAKTQEEEIYILFSQFKSLTASNARNVYKHKDTTPLTSIRRGITNLCNLGKLEKTEDMVLGIYGKPEHIYKLKEKFKQVSIFDVEGV